MEFPYLFSPIKVNNMELKNRIVMTGIGLLNSVEGSVTDRLIDFYTLRARGGVSLIIMGAASIDEFSGWGEGLTVKDDRFIPGLQRLTEAVKSEGAKIAAQINHMGRFVGSANIGGQTPFSASAIPSKLTGETPRALELEEIPDVQDKYAQAAVRVKKAGFDAIELLAGYLIQQFLSPLSNIRTDEYGGSLACRMRFGLEVAEKIRKAVGPDFPFLVRLLGNEFAEGGFTLSESRTFAAEIEKVGVDLINLTGGPHETSVPQITMDVPQGAYVYLAQGIKTAVSIPVMTSNRINDPALAEEIIRNGQADLVAMARGLVADPDMPNKARTGKTHLINHCIGCTQGCLDSIFKRVPVTCLVNPRVSMEREWEPVPAATPKKILVIGGGPAGMKAACTAAERGHFVTLVEKENRLGGQVLLNSLIPGRKEFITLAEDLANNVKALGVNIMLRKEADVSFIEQMAPDRVVLATGARPILPNIPGIDGNHVVQAWDLLAGKARSGKKVVVVGGNAVGVETALYLASQGTLSAEAFHFLTIHRAESPKTLSELLSKGNKDVTVVEMTGKIGQDIGASTRWGMMSDIKRLGVTIMKGTTAVRIRPDGLEIANEEGPGFLDADTIVIAVGSESENSLADKIRNLVPDLYIIGDAKQLGKAQDAVRDGYRVGLEIN